MLKKRIRINDLFNNSKADLWDNPVVNYEGGNKVNVIHITCVLKLHACKKKFRLPIIQRCHFMSSPS